jgi:Tannase and feruloyl esterase
MSWKSSRLDAVPDRRPVIGSQDLLPHRAGEADGKPPTELIATKTAPTGNQTLWRRPICAYPKVAHYKGSGDPTDAASFTCIEQ